MEIQLAQNETHSIHSYNEHSIIVHGQTYTDSLWISRQHIHVPWNVLTLNTLTQADLEGLLFEDPEIILIGHTTYQHAPIAIISALSQLRIGFECMSIGAACRTFNILLAENRKVALGIIFPRE
jgi:uncharacterized protein